MLISDIEVGKHVAHVGLRSDTRDNKTFTTAYRAQHFHVKKKHLVFDKELKVWVVKSGGFDGLNNWVEAMREKLGPDGFLARFDDLDEPVEVTEDDELSEEGYRRLYILPGAPPALVAAARQILGAMLDSDEAMGSQAVN
jgi:hypothetical protein